MTRKLEVDNIHTFYGTSRMCSPVSAYSIPVNAYAFWAETALEKQLPQIHNGSGAGQQYVTSCTSISYVLLIQI